MYHESATKTAINATAHCLLGCAIGEVLGMVLGTLFGWSDIATVFLAIVLAFLFGYALSLRSVLKSGMKPGSAFKIVFAADTLSIATMETVDNLVIVILPGALNAMVTDMYFWISLAIALAVAFAVTVPVNRWLIVRGKGHAVLHEHHRH